MSAARAAFHVSLATSAKLLAGLLAMKLIAVKLGPAGLGQLGNFLNVVAILNVAACGGIAIGVTRYIAEFRSDSGTIAAIVKKAISITLVCTVAIGIPTLLFSRRISSALFGTESFAGVLALGTLLVFPIGLAAIGIALANGFSDTKNLARFQVVSGVLGVGGLYVILSRWGVTGAPLGLLWISACPLVPALLWWFRKHHADLKSARGGVHISAGALTRYGVLTLYSIVLQNGALIKMRSILAISHGWTEVGVWQAMSRLSDAYLQVFLVFLAAYTLPRIAAATTKRDTVRITNESFVFILSSLLLVLCVGFAARHLVIQLLLSDKFIMVSGLFLPQMVGDFFRIAAYIPGYLALAKGSTKLLLIGDPVQVILLIASAHALVPRFGAIGACYAYLVTYLLYAVAVTVAYVVYLRMPERTVLAT